MDYNKTILATEDSLCKLSDEIGMVLEKLDITEYVSGKIEVVLEEVLTNIIYHGYGMGSSDKNKISISLNDENDRIVIEIRDNGKEYGSILNKKALPMHAPQIGGVGILVIKELSDSLEYSRIDTTNILKVSINK